MCMIIVALSTCKDKVIDIHLKNSLYHAILRISYSQTFFLGGTGCLNILNKSPCLQAPSLPPKRILSRTGEQETPGIAGQRQTHQLPGACLG